MARPYFGCFTRSRAHTLPRKRTRSPSARHTCLPFIVASHSIMAINLYLTTHSQRDTADVINTNCSWIYSQICYVSFLGSSAVKRFFFGRSSETRLATAMAHSRQLRAIARYPTDKLWTISYPLACFTWAEREQKAQHDKRRPNNVPAPKQTLQIAVAHLSFGRWLVLHVHRLHTARARASASRALSGDSFRRRKQCARARTWHNNRLAKLKVSCSGARKFWRWDLRSQFIGLNPNFYACSALLAVALITHYTYFGITSYKFICM